MKTYAEITATLDPWTPAHCGAAQREGWDLFTATDSTSDVQVQRLDDPENLPSGVATHLPSDDAAMLVLAQGQQAHHRAACKILQDHYPAEWCNVLAVLIRDVAARLNTSTDTRLVDPLREHATPGCHVGRGADMDYTDTGYRLQLEWFAGQLLSMLDEGQFVGINSWLGCVDKFTTRKPE